MIRVLLADDHPLIREGLRKIFELEADISVVAEAADAEEAVALADRHAPDIVVMDVNMPKGGGLGATRALRHRSPGIGIIILTIHDDEEYVSELLCAGAHGYLLKDADPERIIEAIRHVSAGGEFLLPPGIESRSTVLDPEAAERHAGIESLSNREREVLALIVAGQSNREIAQRLFITEGTVKNHVSSVLRKLHLEDRTQVAVFAVRHQLVVESTLE